MHQTSYVANAALHDPDVFARNARGEITDEQAQGIRRRLVQAQAAIRHGSFGVVGLLFLVGFSLMSSGPLLSGAASAAQTVWAPLLLLLVLVLAAEAVLLAWVRRAWRKVQTTEADLREQRITTGIGVVDWGREGLRPSAYRMHVGAQMLRSPTALSPLPPGRYRCHYLTHSGWLLSAQPLLEAAEAPAGAAAEALTVLARQHGFAPEDLEANRVGRLSSEQCRALRFIALRRCALATLVGFVAAGLSFDLWQSFGERTMVTNLLALFWTGAAWGGAITLVVNALQRRREAAAAGPVRRATGVIRVVFERFSRSVNVFYQVGGRRLELSDGMIRRHAHNSIIEGRMYRVYYREQTLTVVSLEPLEGAPHNASGSPPKSA